jgi:hypothetical protein
MIRIAKALLVASLAAVVLVGASCATSTAPTANEITTRIVPVKDLVFVKPEPDGLIQLAALVDILKDATDADYWRRPGVGIDAEPSGLLAVKASPAMQERVGQVLADLRARK